ncbi:MAG: 3-hexulose-6-phosphate synthase [Candidatus Micrarchaeia archaeon]
MAKLQLALDFVDAERALAIVREAAPFIDIIEAGTPLIKSAGIGIVRRLKKMFPGKKIAADLKIMDVGGVETEMAAKAGAGIVTVCAAADDATIREAVEAGKRYGAKVSADLIGVADPVRRARECEALGVSIIEVHTGIDQQMKGITPFGALRKVVKAVSVPVAVAGGLDAKSAGEAAALGASIVIVGGGITKAADVAKAAKAVKAAIVKKKRASKADVPLDQQIRALLLKASTPNVSDALQRKGEMRGIRGIQPGLKAVGPAVTARTFPGDWAKPVQAIDQAKPGDVVVIDEGGSEIAVWGELATESAVKRKLAGVVIDGAVRDVDIVRKLKFPAFARHISPTAGDPKGFGEIGVEITCGGQTVRPGDWIAADDSGVVVIPKERALEIARRAVDIAGKENRIRAEIKKGETLGKILRLKKWEKAGLS